MATSAILATAPRIQCATYADYTEHLNANRATLAEQLDELDVVRTSSDLAAYAATWTRFSIENGAAPMVFWRVPLAGGEPIVALGFDLASLSGNPRMRHDALRDHADGVEGFRAALIEHLISSGYYIDNRVQA